MTFFLMNSDLFGSWRSPRKEIAPRVGCTAFSRKERGIVRNDLSFLLESKSSWIETRTDFAFCFSAYILKIILINHPQLAVPQNHVDATSQVKLQVLLAQTLSPKLHLVHYLQLQSLQHAPYPL